MRISLDYDKTYTIDPPLWDAFVEAAAARGHTVVCVTMRYPTETIELPIPCEIFYTSRRAKAYWADEQNLKIDVWIDDFPTWLLFDG